jgi:hypothetical protein
MTLALRLYCAAEDEAEADSECCIHLKCYIEK